MTHGAKKPEIGDKVIYQQYSNDAPIEGVIVDINYPNLFVVTIGFDMDNGVKNVSYNTNEFPIENTWNYA